MCAVSAVSDYGMRMPQDKWSREVFDEFLKWKLAAEIFDKKTDQPECVDPEKERLIKEIEERLAKLKK